MIQSKIKCRVISLLLCVAMLLPMLAISAFAENSYEIILGDLMPNGSVSTEEARLILRIAVGIEIIEDPEILLCADVDSDGNVTSSDARMALRMAAGLEELIKYTVHVGELQKATMGTFVFTTYGWGHGVGLSQYGAEAMAKEGKNYSTILHHYYTGVDISTETPSTTQKVKLNDTLYDLKTAVCRILESEMGSYFSDEARKAQAIAIYTYMKNRNRNKGAGEVWSGSGMASGRDYGSKTQSIVNSVWGKYITYNGTTINAIFGAANAGRSASSKTIWGGDLPYLKAVDSPGDINTRYYGDTFTVSSAELRSMIKEFSPGVTLSRYPEEWLKVIEHDGAVSSVTGYISEIRVGNKIVSGEEFRCDVMDYEIRSCCLYFTFIPID